jgi:hypothetical protein
MLDNRRFDDVNCEYLRQTVSQFVGGHMSELFWGPYMDLSLIPRPATRTWRSARRRGFEPNLIWT